MATFHDRRTGQHLETHSGGYFAQPTKAAQFGKTMGRKSSETVDTHSSGRMAPKTVDPRSSKQVAAATSAAAKRPDPFKKAPSGNSMDQHKPWPGGKKPPEPPMHPAIATTTPKRPWGPPGSNSARVAS